MISIRRQYETWPTRSRFYRRHRVLTKLLASDKKSRRLAWIKFLRGVWITSSMHNAGVQERVVFECNMHSLSLFWTVEDCKPRELDWSWGGFQNIFTLAGGDDKRIIRWRPSVRHFHFDDDHVVWIPHSTKHVVLCDREPIIYTREHRTLKKFRDVDPCEWCSL